MPSQKKIPRQRKYRQGMHLNALCKKIKIQRKWKNTCKLKQECRFLHYLTHSKNIPQSKNCLRQLLSRNQYTVLRELVVNDLASNLPTYGSTQKKAKLRKSLKRRLEHLAKGQYQKHYLPMQTAFSLLFKLCKEPFFCNCFFLFLCRMLLALFAGFLVPSCPKLALVFGECL